MRLKGYTTWGAALCLTAGVAGCLGEPPPPPPKAQGPKAPVTFDVTDEPGRWFDTGIVDIDGPGPIPPLTTRSLAIVSPGDKVRFLQTRSVHGPHGPGPSRVESRHTVTSLIWPAGATPNERLDQDQANNDDHDVILNTPGLHVFMCKLHPYMLAGIIVDDPTTTGLDIGDNLHLFGVTHTGDVRTPSNDTRAFTSNSNLGLRLLRAFFIVTDPSNWKDYTQVGTPYAPNYPAVPVRVNPFGAIQPGPGQPLPDGIISNLNVALRAFFNEGTIVAQTPPATPGIGEVWVDTQYEVSQAKGAAYPSTITVVDAATWQVKRKIALPDEKMNNGHNMWASHDQNEIYQTEWHGKSLYVLNRADGSLKQEIVLGPDPAHVMTRVNNGQVHVGLNGGDSVVELNKAPNGTLSENRKILVQRTGEHQAQPHAHWMGFDGMSMVTPNSNTGDSTLYIFDLAGGGAIFSKNRTGTLPIAASMDPRSTRYYVSNYLGHTISVMCGPAGAPLVCGGAQPGEKIVDISLLQNYNPVNGNVGGNGAIGGLPIQTPVSPDGKFVVTGNTLTGTITIIDTSKIDPSDPAASQAALVTSLGCDPGCHGVNFGAKAGGGYYAYVTSKFSNRLIVLDYDPDNDGILGLSATQPNTGTVNPGQATEPLPTIAGSVVLVDSATTAKDDPIIGYRGMGGQGVLPVPNVYNGWVQKLPSGGGSTSFCGQLTPEQRSPFAGTVITPCTP